MAAGLGFKTFTTGEVLTAADTNGYLMQGVLVFASAAARDAAITSPQEGQFAYLKDTNVTTYYTGSAWANLDTTGMTNPMTTTGDIIYSSPGSTPVRLGIGTANQVLRVNSGATAPEWATPAGGGGKVLQVVNVVYSTQTNVSTTTFVDTGLSATITPTLNTSKILVIANNAGVKKGAANNLYGAFKLLRGATDLITFESQAGINSNASEANGIGSVSCNYLDSPATTSATTYKTQFNATASNMAVQQDNCSSTITLLEIGA